MSSRLKIEERDNLRGVATPRMPTGTLFDVKAGRWALISDFPPDVLSLPMTRRTKWALPLLRCPLAECSLQRLFNCRVAEAKAGTRTPRAKQLGFGF